MIIVKIDEIFLSKERLVNWADEAHRNDLISYEIKPNGSHYKCNPRF